MSTIWCRERESEWVSERSTEGYLLVLVWCECNQRIDGKNRKKGNTQSIKIVLHICLYEDNVSMLLYVQMLNFFLLSLSLSLLRTSFDVDIQRSSFLTFFSLLLVFTSPPYLSALSIPLFFVLFFFIVRVLLVPSFITPLTFLGIAHWQKSILI